MLIQVNSDVHSPLGYWRGLWSSLDFADQPLKDCVNVIHTDIVEIWNLKDRNKVSSLPSFLLVSFTHRDQHLSEPRFKENMSHVVQDLAGSAASVPSRCVYSTQIIKDESNSPIVTSPNGFTTYIEAGK